MSATPRQGEIWWAEAQDKRRPVKGLGYFDDLNDDPYLEEQHGPNLKERIVEYWRVRQREVIANFSPYDP